MHQRFARASDCRLVNVLLQGKCTSPYNFLGHFTGYSAARFFLPAQLGGTHPALGSMGSNITNRMSFVLLPARKSTGRRSSRMPVLKAPPKLIRNATIQVRVEDEVDLKLRKYAEFTLTPLLHSSSRSRSRCSSTKMLSSANGSRITDTNLRVTGREGHPAGADSNQIQCANDVR
jgi:hypothetical protein